MQILFSGCSVVQGVGLPAQAQDPDNLANLIGHALNGHVTNIALQGNSNERIFLDTSLALSQQKYDMVFVGWTSYPRHVFWSGLELYECRRNFTPVTPRNKHKIIDEHNGNDISWTSKQFANIRDWFMLLTHDHYYILDICRYVTVLVTLARQQGTRIYFVNNLLAFDAGYFEQFEQFADEIVRPDLLTAYTNKLLNSENRNDDEINALFHKMKKDYQQAGGINDQHWLNLYEPLNQLKIDLGNDELHPGPLSHRRYAELLLERINHKQPVN